MEMAEGIIDVLVISDGTGANLFVYFGGEEGFIINEVFGDTLLVGEDVLVCLAWAKEYFCSCKEFTESSINPVGGVCPVGLPDKGNIEF